MKKRLLVGIMMALVLIMTGCGNDGSTENTDNTDKNIFVSSGNKDNNENHRKNTNDKNLIPSENVYLWASTVRTGNPNEMTTINNKLTSLPITEEILNSLGEFRVNVPRSEDFYTTFSEMLDYSEKYGFLEYESDVKCDTWPKDTVHIHNYNEDYSNTRRELFEQGYWRLETSLDDHFTHKIWNTSTSMWEQFEHYIEVLGNPSYVQVPAKDAERLKLEGAKYYDNLVDETYAEYNETPEDERESFIMLRDNLYLVWEYDDFVLQARIDTIFTATEEIGGSLGREVYDELFYYPKTQWKSYFCDETAKDYVEMFVYDDYAEVVE